MQELRNLQHEFLHHILDKESSIAEKISEQGTVEVTTRLNIYGNAYKLRLKDCIENDHEILGSYLGDKLFDLMADGYIKSKPSHYTSLRDFCEHLPNYLKATEPFSNHPIICELAAFERILLYAFDAADAKSATLQNLCSISQEHWPSLNVRFQPSMQIFQANWNSVQCWQALKAKQTPPLECAQHDKWLIWRNKDRITEFRSLPIEEHAMIDAFLHGQMFSEICELLLDYHSEDTVGKTAINYLTTWLENGIVTKFEYD